MLASPPPPVTAGDVLTLPELQHLEHHLLVFVPCWKLSQAHAILLAKGYGPRMEIASSHLDVIRLITWGAPGAPQAPRSLRVPQPSSATPRIRARLGDLTERP